MSMEQAKLKSIFNRLDNLGDESLQKVLRACLAHEHPGFPIQGGHLDEFPEDILWRILEAKYPKSRPEKSVVDRLKKFVHALLEDVLCDYIRILRRLDRGEASQDTLDLLTRTLHVVQKARAADFKLLLLAAARSALDHAESHSVVAHDVVYHILSAYQACGVTSKERPFWEEAIQYGPIAALSFGAFLEMGGEDCLDTLFQMYQRFPESKWVNFRFLGKRLLRSQGQNRLVKRAMELLEIAQDNEVVEAFLAEVLPDIRKQMKSAQKTRTERNRISNVPAPYYLQIQSRIGDPESQFNLVGAKDSPSYFTLTHPRNSLLNTKDAYSVSC